MRTVWFFFFFFFNDTATTEIYTLSLHDALPIYPDRREPRLADASGRGPHPRGVEGNDRPAVVLVTALEHRSEEHTSELQSLAYLVCRLLLEKKKQEYEPDVSLAGSLTYD